MNLKSSHTTTVVISDPLDALVSVEAKKHRKGKISLKGGVYTFNEHNLTNIILYYKFRVIGVVFDS